ncbi:MAG: type II toxin-antitoxin system Phd/YefM family antitoxin [Acidobacteriaceae bacterium]
MSRWQLQDAKTRLSALIEDANTKGPQIITRHGAERAVVISIEDYRERYAPEPKPSLNLIEFLIKGPPLDDDDEFFEIMNNIRDRNDTGREIDLE